MMVVAVVMMTVMMTDDRENSWPIQFTHIHMFELFDPFSPNRQNISGRILDHIQCHDLRKSSRIKVALVLIPNQTTN